MTPPLEKTPPEKPPETCAERSGFLFSHACAYPAAGTCRQCNKPVCTRHGFRVPEGTPAAGAVLCITCGRTGGYYSTYYGDSPYFYSHYYYVGRTRSHSSTGSSGESASADANPNAGIAADGGGQFDPNDFTEADQAVLSDDGGDFGTIEGSFENDMGGS